MISDKLKEQLGDWTCLYPFFESGEWAKIKEAIKPTLGETTPTMENWFRAFKACPFNKVKVVWLGLSPYFNKDNYTGLNVADGLAFSTDTKHTVPPSLFQLYKGMEWDMWKGINLNMDRTNNLEYLADQGILLLNSALTTIYGSSDSHLDIWKPFIAFVIDTLNTLKKGDPIIYCGFGKVANILLTRVDKSTHKVFEREHPAAAAYAHRLWYHENLFSEVNDTLSKQDKEPILWDRYLTRVEVPF